MSQETEERKKPGVAREYRDDRISVFWAPQLCIHTANCLNAQPAVFDAGRRPWIMLDAADADAISDAVMRCPTGALSFERHDGGQDEPVSEEVTVDPRRNGPLFLRGRIRILDREAGTSREMTRAALCRCGGSSNKPHCDGTHRVNGFRS